MAIQINPIGRINQTSVLNGLGSNPGLLIDASLLPGNNAELLSDDQFTDKMFLNTYAVGAMGPNKQLMRSDVFNAGVLRDNILLTFVFDTMYNDGYTAIAANIEILKVVIQKLDPKTNRILREKTFPIWFNNSTLAYKSGISIGASDNNTFYNKWINFDPHYAYRIEVYTGPRLDYNQGIILDYMFLQYQPRNGIAIPFQSAETSGIEGVNSAEAVLVASTTSAGGTASTRIEPRTGAYITETYNYMNGAYSAINGAQYTMSQFYGAGDVWAISITNSLTVSGAKAVIVSLDITAGATTVYGSLFVIGTISPEEML